MSESDQRKRVCCDKSGGLTSVGQRIAADGVTVDLNPPGNYDIFIESPKHVMMSSLQGGSARVALDGRGYRQVKAAPGSFDLIPAATRMHAELDARAGYLALTIEPEYFARAAATMTNHAGPVELYCRSNDFSLTLAQIAQLMADFMRQGQIGGRRYLESLITLWVMHLVSECSSASDYVKRQTPDRYPYDVSQAIDYIRAHLRDELTLSSIAHSVCKSPYHFARRFKQTTGITPHYYVNQCRLERAQQLLRDTELSIAQIAYEVGFSNQSHMTKLFSKTLGVTPLAFRKRR